MEEPAPSSATPSNPSDVVELDSSFWPRLSAAEWLAFALLAAVLAVTNIYTTLLTGWGDGGSIIAVIGAALLLPLLSKKKVTIANLNLGQTMASAGGSVGFAVSQYAAVKMIDPAFDPSPPVMIAMFVAMGLLGTLIGATVRKQMVRYFFPSGTACAVIQKTVTNAEEAKRPMRLLALWGGIASLVTIPTKITFQKGGSALLGSFSFTEKLGLGVEPLLYGIGMVVGPRIGLGMLLGGLAGPFLIIPRATAGGVAPAELGDWVKWVAIAILTLPTFATILYAYLFRSPPIVPAGFDPGKIVYRSPSTRNVFFGSVFIVGLLITSITADLLFGLPFAITILTVLISWPLCVMNGRVTGETDINPVRLVAIVLLSLFAWFVSGGAVAILGVAIIGGTLAAIAVDMMQDFRTGYLVNGDPGHQTTVQLLGGACGALVAVPFILLIDQRVGFGPETSLPAPGAQVWSAMAKAFAGGTPFSSGLITTIVVISLVGSGYAFLTVWPKTMAYMPSIFGAGIGLLLPFEMSAAIFVGGMIKWFVHLAYTRRATTGAADDSGTGKVAAANRASNDTMLVGSAIFAASAILSVFAVLVTELLGRLGIEAIFLAH